MKFSVQQVNDFTLEEYMDIFSNIIEHCPKFANILYERKPFRSTNAIILILYEYLESLENEEKRAMLTRHPDLSGKFETTLTKQSNEEQKAAQLNTISEHERKVLLELNSRYRNQFGFPFVVCARENNYNTIIHILQKRLDFTQDEEINNGIGEVKKISTLRILDLVEDENKATSK